MQGFQAKKRLLHAFPFPFLRSASILHILPFHAFATVEASHANAHARAIAFSSYLWFKYDILTLHCCKLGSVVIISHSAFNPMDAGSIRGWVVHV